MIRCISFCIVLLFFTIFSSEDMGNNRTAKKLESLLKDFEEPNKLLQQAIQVRKKAINTNENKKIFHALLPDEREIEWKAYKNYFNFEQHPADQDKIISIMQNKWDEVIMLLTKELNFNSENNDCNSYHNLHFTINDFNQLNLKKIMTDNHSSKLITSNNDVIFLGDLLARHLPHTMELKKTIPPKKIISSVSSIIEDVEEAEISSKNQEENNEKFKFFDYLKYNYLMLYVIIRQANFKKQLTDKTIKFENIKYFYCLGNHDCGIVLTQDFQEIGFFNNDLCIKIDKITRFLIPTEIIFTLKEASEVFVFSHSGGMFLLPDKSEKKHYDYSNFNIDCYNYSLTDCCIKNSYNKLPRIDDKYYIAQVASAMESMKHKPSNRVSNPFIWCDFFNQISKFTGCVGKEGRYSTMNIFTTDVLRCLLNTLSINYNINAIKSMRIFRGHEHDPVTFRKYFSKNIVYNICCNSDHSKIFFHHLAPIFFDNIYMSSMKKAQKKFDTICSLAECISEENNEVNINKDGIGFSEQKTKINAVFFESNLMYTLCYHLIEILTTISDRAKLVSILVNKYKIINISKPLQSDENIFIDILVTEIDKFKDINIKDCIIDVNDIDELHKQKALFILKQLKDLSSRIHNIKNWKNVQKFIENLYETMLWNNYNSIKENWNEKIKAEIIILFNNCFLEMEKEKKAEKDKIIKAIPEKNSINNKRLAIIIGYMMPLLFMNIEKCGLGNITTGILMSLFIYFIKIGADKKTTIVFDYLLFISSPFVCSVICLLLSNESSKNVLKHIFDYVSINAYKYNYAFFRNIILQK